MNDILVMLKKSSVVAFTSPHKNGDFRYRSNLNVGINRDVLTDKKNEFTVLRCQENGFMGIRTNKKTLFLDSLKIMKDRKGSISSFNLTEKDSQKYPIIKDLKNNLSYFALRTIEAAPLVFLSESHSSIDFVGNLQASVSITEDEKTYKPNVETHRDRPVVGPNNVIPLSTIARFNGHNWPYIRGEKNFRSAAHILPNIQLNKHMTIPKMNAVSIGTSDLDDLVILDKKNDLSSIDFYYSTGSKLVLRSSKDIE